MLCLEGKIFQVNIYKYKHTFKFEVGQPLQIRKSQQENLHRCMSHLTF